MISSLFILWFKDIKLCLSLAGIALFSIALSFFNDSIVSSVVPMLFVFAGGTIACGDIFSVSKCQTQFSVSPVGRAGYIAAKFVWADAWTLMFYVLMLAVSYTSAAVRGDEITRALALRPFAVVLVTMVVNCVSVPCVCLLNRRVGTAVEIVFVFGVLIAAGVILNAFAHDESAFMAVFDFFNGLNTFTSILLAISSFVLCAALQFLTWLSVRKLHFH